MGQANLRGTREQRQAEALQRQATPPKELRCQTCSAVLTSFEPGRETALGRIWKTTCVCGALTEALIPRSAASDLAQIARQAVREMDKTPTTVALVPGAQ